MVLRLGDLGDPARRSPARSRSRGRATTALIRLPSARQFPSRHLGEQLARLARRRAAASSRTRPALAGGEFGRGHRLPSAGSTSGATCHRRRVSSGAASGLIGPPLRLERGRFGTASPGPCRSSRRDYVVSPSAAGKKCSRVVRTHLVQSRRFNRPRPIRGLIRDSRTGRGRGTEVFPVARPRRLRYKLMLGLALVVGSVGLLVAGTLYGIHAYNATVKTTERKLDELQLVNHPRSRRSRAPTEHDRPERPSSTSSCCQTADAARRRSAKRTPRPSPTGSTRTTATRRPG